MIIIPIFLLRKRMLEMEKLVQVTQLTEVAPEVAAVLSLLLPVLSLLPAWALLSDLGLCPLQHYASRNGHYAVCQFLLESGAKCDAQTHGGATALHRASYCGHTEIARLLLSHGSNPRLVDDDGMTSLHKVCRPPPFTNCHCKSYNTVTVENTGRAERHLSCQGFRVIA